MQQPPEPPSAPTPPEQEPTRDRLSRYAHRTRLYGWTVILLTVVVFIVILIVENTRRVKVGWIVGHSRISLVYLVLVATVLGWLLGIVTGVLFGRRTRDRR